MAFFRIWCLAVLLGAVSCATAPPRADLIIENVTVYAGRGDGPFVASVAVRAGVFSAVRRSRMNTRGAGKVVDGRGLYLTPGLWDMHAHTRASLEKEMALSAFLENGVTSIRDLGGFHGRLVAAQEASRKSAAAGPAIYASYDVLNGEAFAPFHLPVSSAAEARAAVDRLAGVGAAQIKVHRALPPDLLPVVIEAAHAHGRAVVGHIPLGVHPLDACEMGMDGVEHVGSFIEALASVSGGEDAEADPVAYMLSDASAPLYACLVRNDVAVTPTLAIYPAIARRRSGDGPMPQAFVDFIRQMQAIALRLHQSGVMLLSGSDTADTDTFDMPPGASLVDELLLLQEAGIAPQDVLLTATANAASALGLEGAAGTIEVGAHADFLLLTRDPGKDIGNVRAIRSVYRRGEKVFGTD
ncbi:MAG: amidohydrolase family protein [Pseudomonadota bacterium]